MADVGSLARSPLFEALAASAPDAIVTIDSDSTILSADSAVEQIFGYSPDELIGTALTRLMPEHLRQRHSDGLARYIATGAKGIPWTGVELTGLRKDGQEIPIEISFGEFVDDHGHRRFSGFIRDISSRIEQQQRLREALSHLRLQADQLASVEQAIIVTDFAGCVLSWNAFAERLYGWRAEEAIGQLLTDLFVGVDVLPHAGTVTERLRSGEKANYERRVRTRDGRTIWVSITAAPIRDTSGRVSRIIGVSTDITERVRLEEQFLHAQKMDAVGRLASGVAHDFNNLLTVITAHTDLLAEHMVAGSQEAADLAEIAAAARRATALTRQLLTFGRQQSATRERVELNVVLRDLLNMLRRLIGANIEIEMCLAEDTPVVLADIGQLEQVITNLVVNARDAMPRGGQLVVSTGSRIVTQQLAVASRMKPGRFATLSVRDSGTGISPDIRARLFEPFFSTKPAGKGTGLGLATVHTIVQGMDGFIEIDSEEGKGSTFTVHLPAL
jgi:two-component system, cell cycle sensor histidine kinase and response regulator CckA